VTFSLPDFYFQEKSFSQSFHVDDCPELSRIYDMIMGRDLLGELGIIMNFNNYKVTSDTDTIPMKDRDTAINHQ
jgi:hypothetical protein